MGNVLGNLQPKRIWEIFEEIANIPRPSKFEGKIIEYAKKFGENLGLPTRVDEVGNVYISKPATKGMENRKGIILQAHMDMVPQKNSDVVHNFETDPIKPRIVDGWVKATGTTLGGDNGIGVATALAVLEAKDLVHGPIEVLLTIDEETGMTGAFGLKPGILKGDILMNLDSEDEGQLFIGCAGGSNANAKFTYKEVDVPAGMAAFKISVKGLKGGHSGCDIQLGRGNSNKIMFRVLYDASRNLGMRLASIDGGNLRNAIPREAIAEVVVPKGKAEEFKKLVMNFNDTVKSEYSTADPDVTITAEPCEMPKKLIDETTQKNLIYAIYGCPNGVRRMSTEMPGLVETSSSLAIVKSGNGEIIMQALIRSSVDSAKFSVENMFRCVFELAGAEINFDGQYSGWKPNPDSLILKEMTLSYEKLFGTKPEIMAIHAGLECGIIGGVYPNLDMISFGPTVKHPHSPDEAVEISTVEKFWEYMKDSLKNVPKK
ncbi:MAG TPA: aminoacyl-histidine dipeptidase [Ignavibacteria bacterium]|nr:aminoacyl-histidine dipeptidase [Ignavibacteria bacterium]